MRLAAQLAERIQDEVRTKRWSVGTVVGSETELVEAYGVSRATFREAMRLVESSGVASMRRGPGGGMVVTAPDHSSVVAALTIWLSYVSVTQEEMRDARDPLQLAATVLAAERADDEGVASLRAALDAIRGHITHRHADIGQFTVFEQLVADQADNPAISLFAEVLLDVAATRFGGARARWAPEIGLAERRRHVERYARLVDAIETGDAVSAGRRMEILLGALRGYWHDAPVAPRRRSARKLSAKGGKLAARVAAALRDDIEHTGWQVGTNLGSEAELAKRYGVSLTILREAVRLLEHNRAVRTKRGPRGGIFVSEPDGAAVIRAADLALAHEGVTLSQLLEARTALEVAVVRLAALRCTNESAEQLRVALDDDRALGVHRSSSEFPGLHQHLAIVSGNRPLALFIDVLTELSDAYIGPRMSDASPAVSAELDAAHRRIVDAVVAGDAAAAERRMRRHLDAVFGGLAATRTSRS